MARQARNEANVRIKKVESNAVTGDLTPMIDMTFQLIAFFMVLVNFSEADNDQRIQLPLSQLAKPPDGPLEEPIYINMQSDGGIIFNAEEVSLAGLRAFLQRERQVLALNGKSAADATVIIRADARAATGKVQELIQTCQELEFSKFALRAKEDVNY